MRTYFADWSLKAVNEDIATDSAEEYTTDEELTLDEQENSDPQEVSSDDAAASDEPVSEEAAGTDSTEPEEIVVPSEDTTIEEYVSEIVFKGKDYTVTVTDAAAHLPAGIELKAEEIPQDSEEYKQYAEQAKGALMDENGEGIGFARFFDITLLVDGKEYEPSDTVSVSITFDKKMQKELPVKKEENVRVLHFTEDKKTGDLETQILNDESVEVKVKREKLEEAVFEADSFSVYGVISTTIEKKILASDGNNYKITVTCGPEAGIPADADLEVKEITSDSKQTGTDLSYDEYVRNTENALGWQAGSASYVRLFDITIVKGGKKVQPDAPVSVKIELDDADSDKLNVVHFDDKDNSGSSVDASLDGKAVRFEADSFSVYAIVSDITVPEYEEVATKIEENKGCYLSNGGRYILNAVYTDASPNGLKKTQLLSDASLFYFESAGEAGKYYLYTYAGETKKYVYFSYLSKNEGEIKLSDTVPAAPMTVTVSNASKGEYFIAGTASDSNGNTGTWYINQYGGTNGARYAGWHEKDNGSKTVITYPVELDDDALGLDGKTYALINFKSDISGYAMMADAVNKDRLQRKWLLIREDPLTHDGRLFIAADTDVPMWTFHSVKEDIYTLSTESDGRTHFLSINNGALRLTDTYDADTCNIRLAAGTGSYSGKIKLIGMDSTIVRMYENSETNGFGTTTAAENANDWMNLAVKSSIKDEDFVDYSASKVSVSDLVNVADDKQIIIYTRAWNDSTKEYEFYAVDHDGSLVRVYENGDELKWVGTRINTLLWDFTEHTDEATGAPNYYYDLKNDYSGKYLAPQISGNRVLADAPVGIHLNGRRYGEYVTTILAWDDPNYMYSGLRTADGKLGACPMNEAQDFYFAVMDKVDQKLTTVKTVDNNDYGISMKMIDYNGTKDNNGSFDRTQTNVMGSTGNDKGLVKPYLENNYPTSTKTGKSLSELYDGAQTVNHLFLAGTYNESGYFEYNCTENFAHLVQPGDDKWIAEGYSPGDFVVYDQVGTIETSNVSLKHGQFMPYNDLKEGQLSKMYTNQTDETDAVLPYNDPRKDMPLYTIPYDKSKIGKEGNANYHFGMEMTASFTQTANGLDAWGHDIIFEFAGDDDMFLFVDDVLVLDLGGVHAAQTGKVNFKTGQMTSSKGNNTLLKLFEDSRKAQYPKESAADRNAWLATIFKTGSDGKLTPVFQDFSTHTMRMIYMERGAGASNLHMRFNLAAVKPGTVILNKTLSGIDKSDVVPAEYPYQILYKTKDDAEERWHLIGENQGDSDLVKYTGSNRNVKYSGSYTVKGIENPFSHVFFLKPGEAAEITMPAGVTEYKIIECGIDPVIYDRVSINEQETSGTAIPGSTRRNYETDAATLDQRQTVTYDNHISRDALRTLTFTKEVYDVNNEKLSKDHVNALFSFRLSLGGENDDAPAPANMQPYHVKDENGNYCRWDSESGGFVSTGKTEYSSMTDEEKEQVTFHTSINGAVSYIPADYTVEVRQILTGTQYGIVERAAEVPKGYSWKGYLLNGEPVRTSQDEGIQGVMPEGSNPDPVAVVQNYKGWGLTVEKIWTDADFIASHDTVYFAVYVSNDRGEITLIPDTVRAMKQNKASIYWYFEKLSEGITDFNKYVVREVVLTGNPVISEDGSVSGYDSITPAEDGDTVRVKATPFIDDTETEYPYTVTYEQGKMDPEKDNIRTDKVTNSRPGIRIVKTDLDGNPLSKAEFTLKNGEGRDVGKKKYISDEEGLVTIAYLPDGSFILDEIKSPSEMTGITGDLRIEKNGEDITVTGQVDDEYSYEPASEGKEAVITVKNRPFAFSIIKTDAESGEKLEGVHFALYRQVRSSDGELIRDYDPMEGYEDLVTDKNGLIEGIDNKLAPGTYYLEETKPLDSYQPLEHNICFTISDINEVTLKNTDSCSIEETTDEKGTRHFTITVTNSVAIQKLQNKKVDVSAPDSSALANAVFDLYSISENGVNRTILYSGIKSGPDGMLSYSKDGEETTVFVLPVGLYHLVETAAPDGYNLMDKPVLITVTSSNVTYDDGTVISRSGSGRTYDFDTGTYTLKVTNTAGTELPASGGPGTALFYILGLILLAVSGSALVIRRRMQHR